MLTLTKPTEGELPLIRGLYETAFPANERRPLAPLLNDATGHAKVLAAHNEQGFCGFICTLEWSDILHIIYFAVPDGLRGQGIGSRVLREFQLAHPAMRVVVDIEEPDDSVSNNEQRVKRKAFYLRNGYTENDIHYTWRGTDYTILSCGGPISDQEFGQFWQNLRREMPGSENY